MKASMKLKRHLPCAPFPPTLPVRENRIVMTEYGNLIRLDGSSPINRMPSSIGYSVTEQTARNSHEAAKAEKRRRWAIVEKMRGREEDQNAESSRGNVFHRLAVVRVFDREHLR